MKILIILLWLMACACAYLHGSAKTVDHVIEAVDKVIEKTEASDAAEETKIAKLEALSDFLTNVEGRL